MPTLIFGVRTSRQPADCSDGLSKYDDRSLFEAWFQQCLLPALTQKSVIILDNARFHRMGVLREMAEKLGHKVLPLAPYSPELNPIEKVWANIKRYLQTVLSDYARFDDALLSYFDFN
ncbi:TPA: transposase [Neisseria meningitidis]